MKKLNRFKVLGPPFSREGKSEFRTGWVLKLINYPPLELDIFRNGRIETDSKRFVGLGEDLEVLIFATFCDSDVYLGSRRNVVVGNGDFFLTGWQSGIAGERIRVGLIGDGDGFVFLGGGDDETTVSHGLDGRRVERGRGN